MCEGKESERIVRARVSNQRQEPYGHREVENDRERDLKTDLP